ncbi:transposable element Tcb2 transposase [Trichonephila clavipes]|nr:transposable element Tcb2 transposase [Trichonephila clavipes]
MYFGSHRPTRIPLLNARHRAARLAGAREHKDWSVEVWKRVAWSDASLFLLNTDRRLKIWGQAHEAMDPAYQAGTVQGRGGSILVWVCLFVHCFGSLERVPTSFNAMRVVGRLEGGQTQAEVAQAIGVSQSVISRIWKSFLVTGSAGQGRRRAATPNEDRF